MKFLRVNKFLCCFTLETGGLVIGCLAIMCNLLRVGWMVVIIYKSDWKATLNEEKTIFILAATFSCAIYLLYFILFLIGAVQLIRATKNVS